MAVTTVSSLAESFATGGAVLGDEVGFGKDQDKSDADKVAVGEKSRELDREAEIPTTKAGEESDDEDDFGVLQVHD